MQNKKLSARGSLTGSITTLVDKKRVFVAMSGGVDSSVAAALLQNQGYQITGVFMKTWTDPAWPCPWQEDRLDALRVCLKLAIPFEMWDFTAEYKSKVVDYMVAEYLAGRTPNPDVMCNREIKFGLFLRRALERGADFAATGHYVRLSTNSESFTNKRINESENIRKFVNSKQIRYSLIKAKDQNKDQSYFLWTLKQEQLAKCLFPIGEIESKAKVRELAREFGLPTAEKKDSQGICFMGPVNVAEFIKPYVKTAVGDIVTTLGQKIGTHSGLDFFTIGQRQGIGIGGTGPYYVAQKNYAANTLVVAPANEESALESQSLVAKDVSFIGGADSTGPIDIEAAVRYRQEPVPAKLEPIANGQWRVVFNQPVRAITPGQSVVFYRGEELLGGGVIDKS